MGTLTIEHEKKGIVLLSGGLDSATVAAIALERNYHIIGLSFDYGQRHRIELEMSKKLAKHYSIEQKIFKIDLTQIGGSSLTSNIKVEEGNLQRDKN